MVVVLLVLLLAAAPLPANAQSSLLQTLNGWLSGEPTPTPADQLETTLLRLAQEGANQSIHHDGDEARRAALDGAIEFQAETVAGGLRLAIWFPIALGAPKDGRGGDEDLDPAVTFYTRQIAEHVLTSYSWQQTLVFRGYTKRPSLMGKNLVIQYSFDPTREMLILDYKRPTAFTLGDFLEH
jgi:hypothetical protein